MILMLESDVGIHTAQKLVDQFEKEGKNIKNYDSMEDYLISILYDFTIRKAIRKSGTTRTDLR